MNEIKVTNNKNSIPGYLGPVKSRTNSDHSFPKFLNFLLPKIHVTRVIFSLFTCTAQGKAGYFKLNKHQSSNKSEIVTIIYLSDFYNHALSMTRQKAIFPPLYLMSAQKAVRRNNRRMSKYLTI